MKALAAGEGQRFFATAGYFSNREIADIVRKNFPGLKDMVPGEDVKGGDYPEGGVYKYDNEKSKGLLGKPFIQLEESIVDLVKSLDVDGA